jgi:regulator of protease activity HflC (stomatin/prohibitin superfamily)
MIRPVGDRMQKVNMQIIAMAVPAQEGITRDNVTVQVDAVVYFRVVDPIKAVVNVQNYMFAVSPAGADVSALDHRPIGDGRVALGAGLGQP